MSVATRFQKHYERISQLEYEIVQCPLFSRYHSIVNVIDNNKFTNSPIGKLYLYLAKNNPGMSMNDLMQQYMIPIIMEEIRHEMPLKQVRELEEQNAHLTKACQEREDRCIELLGQMNGQ